MSILSGFFKTKKYRKTDTGYQLQSEWTSASTVEMADGNTAETNLGDIKGITDSLTATNSNVALSAAGGNNLQTQIDELNSNLNDLNDKFSWISVGSINLGTSKTIKFNDKKPTDPNEICVRIMSTDIYYNTWLYTIPVIKNVAPLVSWGSIIRFGDSNSQVQINFKDTEATLSIFTANGSNYLNNENTTFAIYMR